MKQFYFSNHISDEEILNLAESDGEQNEYDFIDLETDLSTLLPIPKQETHHA